MKSKYTFKASIFTQFGRIRFGQGMLIYLLMRPRHRMVVVQVCQEMVDTVKLCGPGIVAEREFCILTPSCHVQCGLSDYDAYSEFIWF